MTDSRQDLGASKRKARTAARARRRIAFAADGGRAAVLAAERFERAIAVVPGQVIAGYWPVGDEIDPLPLLQRLRAAGAIVALPVVVAKDQPLEFRRWPLTKKPPPGAHGIPAPGPDAPLAVPEILLVPLLAFDGLRRRLGSGLGYYDRTLARLRAGAKVLAVGFAFAAQRDESLPHGPDDQVLDWVVTETEVFSNMKERNG